jgi:hypothetical protein
MAILKPTPFVQETDFSFTNNTFTAESSTLFGPLNGPNGEPNPYRMGEFGQVYDDACDEGFTMVGKTGRKIVFALERTDEVEGEVAGWWFVAVTPGHKGYRALIIND